MARGGRKSSIPAIRHGTLRDGRKGDPQHVKGFDQSHSNTQIQHNNDAYRSRDVMNIALDLRCTMRTRIAFSLEFKVLRNHN